MNFFRKKKYLDKQPRGMIIFLILLILGVTATATILLLSQSSLNGFLSIDEKIKSEQVRSELFGCLDEILIHFAANANYNPTAIDVASYSCSVSIQMNGDQRIITLLRVNQSITRRLVADINVGAVPITVSAIQER